MHFVNAVHVLSEAESYVIGHERQWGVELQEFHIGVRFIMPNDY